MGMYGSASYLRSDGLFFFAQQHWKGIPFDRVEAREAV